MKVNVDKFKKVMEVLNQDAPSYAQIKALVASFVKAVKETKAALEKLVGESTARNKAEIASLSKQLNQALSDLEKRVGQKDEDSGRTLRQELANTRQQLLDSVKAVADLIPDDRAGEIASLVKRLDGMSQLLLAENIRNALEVLQGEDRLDKSAIKGLDEELLAIRSRPAGGVSDMRIRQAFKYILHTEEPVGDIDGVNTTYTVANVPFAVMGIVINGEHIAELPNYTIAGRNIVFASAIPAAYSGKDFEIKYIG